MLTCRPYFLLVESFLSSQRSSTRINFTESIQLFGNNLDKIFMLYSHRDQHLCKIAAVICVVFLFVNFLQGCDSHKPDGHKSVSISGDLMAEFRSEIIPIFEERCGVACHGVSNDAYETFLQKDPINKVAFYFPYDRSTGRIAEEDYELTYSVSVGHDRVDYSELPRFSHLLRAPLAVEYGGQAHRGLDVFYSDEDDGYRAMERWLTKEIDENKKEPKQLSENVAYFEDHILGVMERNGCFLSSCHDSQVFNDLKLIPPLPRENIGTLGGIASGFSTKMMLQNREVVLGTVSRLVNLGGDLDRSRLIAKNIPIEEGGIHQRGGNNQFFESMDDADVKRILNWARLERKALASTLKSEGNAIVESDIGKVKGLVFIRGPRHVPRTWFSFDKYFPGSDIFLLPLKEGETLASASASPINLTAAFHEDAVEIQSLDVRYDAKRVVFSMRRKAEEGFRLYELRINDAMTGIVGTPQQISFSKASLSDGTLIHHIDPIYMPGPTDKEGQELADVAITFASNQAGHYVQSDTWGILGEADSHQGKIIFDQQRPEDKGTFDGKRIYFVAGPNEGEWRTITQHTFRDGKGSGAALKLDHSLPHKVDNKSVYVIEKTQGAMQSSFDIWRFVPRSFSSVVTSHNGSADESSHDSGHEVSLSAADLDGLNLKQRFDKSLVQVTFTHAQERRPTTRTTGETMFTSVRNFGFQGDKPVFNGAIYRVQAGGFDYHIQGGNRSGYGLFSDSREMGNGLEIRQMHDPRNLWSGGSLTLSDHGFGINTEPDNPVDNIPYSIAPNSIDIEFSSPPRFISAQMNFFDEQGENAVTHTGVSPGGAVRDPYPLLDGSVLVAYTPESLNHLDHNADPNWDLYTFDFIQSPHAKSGNKVGEFKKIKILAASSSLAEYSPRPLMLRLKEKVKQPIHHQKFGSRTPGILPKEEFGILRMPPGTPGEIECYDYPLLQSFLTNFAPVGSKDFRIQHDNPNGTSTSDDRLFKYVRIIMQEPNEKALVKPIYSGTTGGDPFASAVSLGIHTKRVIVDEVPIEDDGSFFVEVPTNVPLIVQGLNSEKMAMHSMNRWVYLQPGEKLTFAIPRPIYPLRCAGCHGSLTGDPYDGVGPADLVSASSRVMATWNLAEEKRRSAYGYDRQPSEYISIDYVRDVQPIFDNHCTECHSGENAPGNLDLDGQPTQFYSRSYESLHQLADNKSGNYANKKYINEREALSSESLLIKSITGDQGLHLFSENLSKNISGDIRINTLSQEDKLTLIRWIDLGATFLGADVSTADKTLVESAVNSGQMSQ